MSKQEKRMERYCAKGNHPNSAQNLINHERNNKVLPCPEGPVKWPIWKGKKRTEMSYRGVTRTLKNLFYPDISTAAVSKKRRFGTSSMKTGSTVHRHLYHHFSCKKKRLCYCKTKSRKTLTPYATQAIKKLNEMKITVEDAEVPVISHSTRMATRLDLVGTRWKGETGERSVIISIKTGYAFPGDKGELEGNVMEHPFDKIPNTFANQNQLQGACEVAMLKNDYRIEFDDYYLLYLGKPKATVERLEKWAKSETTVNTMMTVLKNRFKKKQKQTKNKKK